MIEFVIEVPNEGVAGDVGTRIGQEHQARLVDVFQSVTSYQPHQTPDRVGFFFASEPVTWDAAEGDWIGPDDDEPDDDE